MVYAVVRAGGRQEKVEVGTIVTMDRIKADNDGNVHHHTNAYMEQHRGKG